jgi:colanic acid/amylovoran biosynthesis glycosyltransferase
VSRRLAYMTGQYPRATDTFIQREVATLRSLGYTVETFSVRKPAMKENVGPEQESERRQTHYLLPPSPIELLAAHGGLFFSSPLRYFSAIGLAWKIRPPGVKGFFLQIAYFAESALVARRMSRRNLEHLHNHFANSSGSVAVLAAKLGGFSYSLTIHGPAEFVDPYYWHMGDKAERALFVNCISEYCRNQVKALVHESAWPKLHIIHCGVDPSRFSARSDDKRTKKILFVGRLASVKGLPHLLKAIARVRGNFSDVELTIAGDGPDRALLEAMANSLKLGSAVRFLGYQSQAQVRELLSQTDLFAMSSFAEGVPVVLMEAMAAGVAVVATNVAGIPELVEEGVSGYLVSPGDEIALAEKISVLLADENLRSRFGQAGRKKVEREFDIRIEARRLARILESAMIGLVEPVRPEPLESIPNQPDGIAHDQSTAAVG